MFRLKSKKSSVILIALLIILALNGCSGGTEKSFSGNKPEIIKKEKWTEIGKDMFVFTSAFYLANMTIIVSGNEAVLIDTGMDKKDSETLQGFLKDRNLKLTNILITHMHGDHAANLSMLKTNDITPITPENAKDKQKIKFRDKTLQILFTEGHYMSKGHISVEVVEDHILIAGDIICNNIIPPIAAGGSIKDLLKTLDQLKKEKYALIIPGHGEVVDTDLMFDRQFEYLNNAKAAVEKVIAAKGSIGDLHKIKLEDCIKYTSYLFKEMLDYWHTQSLRVIYTELL